MYLLFFLNLSKFLRTPLSFVAFMAGSTQANYFVVYLSIYLCLMFPQDWIQEIIFFTEIPQQGELLSLYPIRQRTVTIPPSQVMVVDSFFKEKDFLHSSYIFPLCVNKSILQKENERWREGLLPRISESEAARPLDQGL